MQQSRDDRTKDALNDFVDSLSGSHAQQERKEAFLKKLKASHTELLTDVKGLDDQCREAKRRVETLELECARMEGQIQSKRGELSAQTSMVNGIRAPRLEVAAEADSEGAAFDQLRDDYVDAAMALARQCDVVIRKNDPTRLQEALATKQRQIQALRERVALLMPAAAIEPPQCVVPSRTASQQESSATGSGKSTAELKEEIASLRAKRLSTDEANRVTLKAMMTERDELRAKLQKLTPEIEEVDRLWHMEQKEYSEVIDALAERVCDTCGNTLAAMDEPTTTNE